MLDGYVSERLGLSLPLDRERLEARRLSLLKSTVEYAVNNSRFYEKRLSGMHFDTLEEFSRLPFTYPDDLRTDGSAMLCVSPRDTDRVVTLLTSGTTGTPKRIFFTSEELKLTETYFMHGMAEFVSPGQRIVILFPGKSPDCLNDILSRALVRLGTIPYAFGFPTPERYTELLQLIFDGSFDFLVGPPEAISGFARFAVSVGADKKLAGQIRGVLLAASFASDGCINEIKAAFRCEVFGHYSMTETAYAGCVGCTKTDAYHSWESDVYYEIVDPESGIPLPAGERGEIVVTTFGKRAMPFIRYRTGDISRLITVPCPCGSRLYRLGRVESRPEPKKFERPGVSEVSII